MLDIVKPFTNMRVSSKTWLTFNKFMLDKFLVYNIMNLKEAIKQHTIIKNRSTSVENFHNAKLKLLKLKRIWLVLVDTLNSLKSSSLHIKSTFSQECHVPLKLNLKISLIAHLHDVLLNLKKYNNKLLLNK
jgi:hypothetical protein